MASAKREPAIWQVEFRLPEYKKEPSGIEGVEGSFLLSFYTDPMLGDLINWGGYQWEVVGRSLHAVRHDENFNFTPVIFVKFIDANRIDRDPKKLSVEALTIYWLSTRYGFVSAKDCSHNVWSFRGKTPEEIESYFLLLSQTGFGVLREASEVSPLKFCAS